MPKVPQPGSRQYLLLEGLIRWGKVWTISEKGWSHKEFVGDIAKLREKGWPIEDTEIDDNPTSKHAYRLDPERWAVIKNHIQI